MRLRGIGLLAVAGMALAGCEGTESVFGTDETTAPVEATAPILRPETGTTAQERLASAAGDTVFFETASHQLSLAARQVLVRQAEWLKLNPGIVAAIEGHADPRGPEPYNQRLGQRRANAVFGYLSQLGVSPEQMRTWSYGETRRAGTGGGAAELAKDRRAVTIVGAPGAVAAPAAVAVPQAAPIPAPQPLTFTGQPVYRTLPTYNTFPAYSPGDSFGR